MNRPNHMKAVVALTLALTTSSAFAELAVSFDEGAPKDRFTFKNAGECALEGGRIDLDLSQSTSGLIFDVTRAGAGVEVFQPLEFVKGREALSDLPRVRDGDNRVSLNIQRLAPGQEIAFTIDVDDTMGGREITVSDAEIKGAMVRFINDSNQSEATFDRGANAVVKLAACG